MKPLRLITILAGVLSVVALSSCRKDRTQPGLSIDISIEVTDISAINAMLKISGEGDEPALIRMVSAVPESEVIETVGTLDNPDAVKSYISGHGEAISLPYSAVLKDLNPETRPRLSRHLTCRPLRTMPWATRAMQGALRRMNWNNL